MQTWNERIISSQHEQHFKNLLHLHQLTLNWIDHTPSLHDGTAFPVQDLRSEIKENLWMLPSLLPQNDKNPMWNISPLLQYLLDDTEAQDTLERLEETVWSMQSIILKFIYDQTILSQKATLESHFEQITWKLGKAFAKAHWPKLAQSGREDLRKILIALHDSPFVGYPKNVGFLVKRSTPTEILIELKKCPHQTHYPEIKPMADKLCRIHSHWMRGFGYALNNQVSVEHLIHSPRCIQRWFITTP